MSSNSSGNRTVPGTSDHAPGQQPGHLLFVLACIALAVGATIVLFWTGIVNMYGKWHQPEYNHGFMIPLVAIYLLWLRAPDVTKMPRGGSWLGVAAVVLSLGMLVLGDRSATFAIAQYALIMAIWALVYASAGWKGIKLLWVPLLYLAFMVPLPHFIELKLTTNLMLWSSQIGVAVIRAVGMPVFLEGNVIDLGSYQLQVAEACSGMRYLFPLTSFGFLCAVLFRGRWWQRLVLLVATVPITIFMNSFRIGVIGILVNKYGIEQAEGFLHDFEGWVVFMASVGILFIIVWIFARMERRPFLEIFGLDVPPLADMTNLLKSLRPNPQFLAALGIVVVAAVVSRTVSEPPTLVPDRAHLATFPLVIGDFSGREFPVEKIYLDELKLSDYLMSRYTRPSDDIPVEIWIAYYDSQAKGASIHSPQACLPGGGWQIESFTQPVIPNVQADGSGIKVNRAVIAMGDARQLVYYWFDQHGKKETSEYKVKWLIFWDGLTQNRTDGALVRLTTLVMDKADLPKADARLQDFMRAADPKLAYYLPNEHSKLHEATGDELARFEAITEPTKAISGVQ